MNAQDGIVTALRPLVACVTMLFALLTTHSARALDSAFLLSQYGHTSWRVQDGYLGGSPRAFAQTPDGYLWIGTTSGLLRFDGVEFHPEPRAVKAGNPYITSLYAARDGSLWIGRPGAIVHMHGNTFDEITVRSQPNRFAESATGEIYFVRSRMGTEIGPLCRIESPEPHCYGPDEGVPIRFADEVAAAADGALWIAGNTGVVRWTNGTGTEFFSEAIGDHVDLRGVEGIAVTSNHVFAGLRSTDGLDIRSFDGTGWLREKLDGAPDAVISSMHADLAGHLWIGTLTEGAYRLANGKLDHFGTESGLSGNRVDAIFEDAEGDMWFATPQGIDRLRDLPVVSFSRREGFGSEEVAAVASDGGDSVLVSDGPYLDRIISGADGFRIESEHTSTSQEVLTTSIGVLPGGAAIVGVDDRLMLKGADGLVEIRRADGRHTGMIEELVIDARGETWARNLDHPGQIFHFANGHLVETIDAGDTNFSRFAPDQDGTMWIVASTERVMKVSQGKLVDVWGKPQTNIGSNVRQAFVDEPDAFWMATPAGIAHMDHGVTRWLKSETGALPCDSIFGLQSDLEGGLWAYASCGIFFLSHATLEAWLRDPSAEVSARLLDAYDGANPAASMFTARSARTADGRIWFANGGVVQMVDPSHAFTSPRPPSTPHIEAATADHVALNTVSRIEVPARTRDLDVEYSAPALRAPQRTAYRYKLDDYDRAWHAVDARRHAIYTGVAPGHYVLHVASSNNGEDWSLPASVDVNIAYAFYETTAFRAAAGLAVLLAVAFAYRWRTRQLAVQASSRFEAAIRERERIARELHDTLLQSNQGLLLQVEGAARRMPADDPSREQLETALTHARAAIIEGRARVSAMRTHADIDAKIETLLSRVCQELKSHFRIDCHVELEGTARDVNPAVADEIYWIVREAAINACRHAQARRVDVGVDYSGRDLSVHVRDDGIGIGDDVHSKSGHFGIAGMHERARMIGARVTIARAIKGTHVSLVVPAAIAWAKSSVLGRSSKPPTT